MNEKAIAWENLRLVIFDVDGTLYNQSGLRKRMLVSLLGYYGLRPHRFRELQILYHFRKERELRAMQPYEDLENSQYQWCADKTGFSLELIRATVNRWMFQEPNQYLSRFVFPGLKDFIETLQQRGIKTAIYSDYKADDKLKHMGLKADLVVSSTDAHIDRLKPDPKAVFFIMETLGVEASECLFIGDRPELDGICAERAGIPYLIIGKGEEAAGFYRQLQRQLLHATGKSEVATK